MFDLKESPWKWVGQYDFSGGENQDIKACKQNQLLVAETCELDRTGYLMKSDSYTNILTGTQSYDVQGAWVAKSASGALTLYIHYNGDIKAASWDGTSTIDISSFSTVKANVTTSVSVSAVQWGDYMLFFPSGATVVAFSSLVTTPTSVANISNAPINLVGVCVYGNAVWGFTTGSTATTNTLRFSAIGDFLTWDALDIINVAPTDGETLQQLQPQDGGLLLHKKTKSYTLYGVSRSTYSITTAPSLHTGVLVAGASTSNGFLFGAREIYKYILSGAEAVVPGQAQFFADASGYPYVGAYLKRLEQVRFFSTGTSGKSVILNVNNMTVFKGLPVKVLKPSFTSSCNIVDLNCLDGIAGTVYDYLIVSYGASLYGLYGYKFNGSKVSGTFLVQTRHEDFGSKLNKACREICLNVDASVTSVTVKYFLDGSSSGITAFSGDLAGGDNFISIDAIRFDTLSISVSTSSAIILKGVKARVRECVR